MIAAALTRSAYPASVDELMPHAIELAKTLKRVPSRNQIMKQFRVGSPKATAVREALDELAEQDRQRIERFHYQLKRGQEVQPPTLNLYQDPAFETLPETGSDAPTVTVSVIDEPQLSPQVSLLGHPDTEITITEMTEVVAPGTATAEAAAVELADVPVVRRRPVVWPVLILCAPAFVAIWAGWVEMGRMTGFGKVALLPGIVDRFQLDTAITLPIGVETYAAYALWVWLSGRVTDDARKFAKWSAIGSLGVGCLGQLAYHLMNAAGWTSAPWPVTAVVACMPVAVLGMGAALAHLMHNDY
jgi:hypothetical protein